MLGVLDQGVVSLTNFGTTVLVGKLAGVSALGEYALAFAVLVLAMTVQDCFVVSPYTVYGAHFRRRGRGGAQRRLGASLLLLAAALGLGWSVAALLVGQIGGLFPGAGVPGAALAIAIPAFLLRELVRRIAIAHLEMASALAVDLIWGALQIGLLAAVAAWGGVSSSATLLAVALASAATGGGWVVLHPGILRARRRDVPGHWKLAVGYGKWLCAARLTSVMHDYSVPWMLGLMVGTEAVGGFAAAFALIAMANPVLMGLTSVLAPRAARAWAEGGAPALQRVIKRATAGLVAVTLAFCATLPVAAGPLLGWLYGPEYATFAGVGVVLGVALLAEIVGIASEHGLRAIERPELSLAASACGLVLTMMSTLVLVPMIGVMGGACGLAIGSAAASVAGIVAFRGALSGATTNAPVGDAYGARA